MAEGIRDAVLTGKRLESPLDNLPIDGDREAPSLRADVAELHGEVVLTLTPTHR